MMKRIANKMLLALAVMAVMCATARPAVAAPTLQFFQMGDPPNQQPAGAWFAFPTGSSCGLFHLYFIQGTDLNGPIYNPGGTFSLPLADGIYDFTLLGSGGITGPEANLILGFAEGSFTIDTLHPNGSVTFGQTMVKVTKFTFENYNFPGHTDRIGTCYPNPDNYVDAVGHLTLEVCTPFPEGLVSLWPGQGNAVDVPGSNDGILMNGTSFAPGMVGQAFSFDGVDDYVRVPANPSLPHGSSPRTIALWAYTRPSSWVGDQNTIFHFGGAGVSPGYTTGSTFSLDMDPYPNMQFYSWGQDIVFDAGVPQEGWVHVAITYDGGTVSIYTQGQLRASRPMALNTALTDLEIGAFIGSPAFGRLHFDGLIDEFTFFDRALSAAEVQTLYNNGIEIDTTPPAITLNGANPLTLECHADTYTESGAITTDNCDLSPHLDITGAVDIHMPGSYKVTYTATDHTGNVATAMRIVNVVDTQRPTVTLAGPATMTIECHASFTDPGATALDTCDGDLTASIVTTGSVDANTVGSYTLSYTATDHSGNSNSTIRTVNVVDTTAPVVTAALTAISRDRDEDEDGNFYLIGATATDACDAHPAVSALITQPLTSSTSMTVSYKKEKHNRIQLQVEKKKLVVKLEGPSESALRALWTQVLAAGGFSVSDGQQLQLVLKKDKGEYEAQYRFDRELKLTSAKGPGLKLVVVATDASGNSATATAVPARLGDDDDRRLSKRIAGVQPGSFALNQNYPNPFNPSTTISYDLVEATAVRLTIYNVMGQEVRELVAGAQEAGSYEVQWDGRDGRGQLVASGFYLYRLQAGDQVAVQKMLFAK